MRNSQNTFIKMVSINAKINTSFSREISREKTMLSVLYMLNEKNLLRTPFIVETLEFNRYINLFSSFNKSILGQHFLTRSKRFLLISVYISRASQ